MDAGLLERILWHIHNWFERETITLGECTITDGSLPASVADSMLEGRWYRIEGSYLNDGLHQHPDYDLADETFSGTISLLAIPRPLLLVAEDIQAWIEENGSAADGPYASESFGGYSYTLKTDGGAQGGSGGLSGWRLAFRDQLNAWRKIS